MGRVGEIEEAAACLYILTTHPDWEDAAIVQALRDDLVTQYGRPRLSAALNDLFIDSPDHHIPRPSPKGSRPMRFDQPVCSTAPAAKRAPLAPSSRPAHHR